MTMQTANIALFISLCSVLIAATSLGWNIYRDVIRRPKLHLSLMAGQIAGTQTVERRLVVTITNHGPGKTKAQVLQLRKTSCIRRLFRKNVSAILMPDDGDSYSGRLPADLDVGDKVTLTFRSQADIFILKKEFDQIGISDPFGRSHWSSRSDYKRARLSYIEQNHKRTEPTG